LARKASTSSGKRRVAKAGLSKRRTARKAYEQARETSPLGEGKRFAALANAAEVGGARNPNAVAAKAGMEKYGKERMTKWAIAGKKKKRKRK